MNSEQKTFLKKLGLNNSSIDYFSQGFKTILEKESLNKNENKNQVSSSNANPSVYYNTSSNNKLNRNDKCACGSGKKFKKCCLK